MTRPEGREDDLRCPNKRRREKRVNKIYLYGCDCKKNCKPIFSVGAKIIAQDVAEKLKMVKKIGDEVANVNIKSLT